MTTINTAPAIPDDALTGQPAYTRLSVYGLGLIAAAITLLTVVFAATGSDQLGLAVVIVAVLVVLAGLAWRYGIWTKVIAIVISALFGFAFFPMTFGIIHPTSPLDFIPALLMPTGVLMTVVGSAAAIRHRRDLTTQATVTERRIMQGLSALLLVAVAASTIAGLAARTTVELANGRVPVDMRDYEFPAFVEAKVGEQLVIHNSDGTVHDFTVPQLDLTAFVLPGNDGVIDLSGVPTGTYTVYCTLHSDASDPDPATAGMATTLTVTGS
jgi:plastocyanin